METILETRNCCVSCSASIRSTTCAGIPKDDNAMEFSPMPRAIDCQKVTSKKVTSLFHSRYTLDLPPHPGFQWQM